MQWFRSMGVAPLLIVSLALFFGVCLILGAVWWPIDFSESGRL